MRNLQDRILLFFITLYFLIIFLLFLIIPTIADITTVNRYIIGFGDSGVFGFRTLVLLITPVAVLYINKITTYKYLDIWFTRGKNKYIKFECKEIWKNTTLILLMYVTLGILVTSLRYDIKTILNIEFIISYAMNSIIFLIYLIIMLYIFKMIVLNSGKFSFVFFIFLVLQYTISTSHYFFTPILIGYQLLEQFYYIDLFTIISFIQIVSIQLLQYFIIKGIYKHFLLKKDIL